MTSPASDPIASTNVPLYTPDEARNRETFLALMWALSYPGRIQPLTAVTPLQMLATIGAALLDRETTYFTPDMALANLLNTIGARPADPTQAAYHFYLDSSHAIETIAQASVGDALYPDRSATIFIIGQIADVQEPIGSHRDAIVLTVQGPGVKGTQDVRIGGIPESLWTVRKRRIAFPLGWDLFIVDPVGRVVGFPRSTQIV